MRVCVPKTPFLLVRFTDKLLRTQLSLENFYGVSVEHFCFGKNITKTAENNKSKAPSSTQRHSLRYAHICTLTLAYMNTRLRPCSSWRRRRRSCKSFIIRSIFSLLLAECSTINARLNKNIVLSLGYLDNWLYIIGSPTITYKHTHIHLHICRAFSTPPHIRLRWAVATFNTDRKQ